MPAFEIDVIDVCDARNKISYSISHRTTPRCREDLQEGSRQQLFPASSTTSMDFSDQQETHSCPELLKLQSAYQKLQDAYEKSQDELQRAKKELSKLRSDLFQAKVGVSPEHTDQENVENQRPKKCISDECDALLNFSFWQFTDAQLQCLTSLPSRHVFLALASAIRAGEKEGKKLMVGSESRVCIEDQILLTLTKLRRNMPFYLMEVYWGLSSRSICRIFANMIRVLHGFLWLGLIKKDGVPKVEKNLPYLPEAFLKLKNCRLILDCFDAQIHVPKSLGLNRASFSYYRNIHSFKYLLGISPTGLVSFISEPFGGRAPDDVICDASGVWDIFEPGDLALVDKGFRAKLAPSHIEVKAPTFKTRSMKKLKLSQLLTSKEISKLRSHVERAVQRVKMFKIIHSIPYQYRSKMKIIVELCAALVNFQPPMFAELRDVYKKYLPPS